MTLRNAAEIVAGETLYPTPNSWFCSQIKVRSAVCGSVEQWVRGPFSGKKVGGGGRIATTLQQSDSINTQLLWDLVTCWCLTLRLPPPRVGTNAVASLSAFPENLKQIECSHLWRICQLFPLYHYFKMYSSLPCVSEFLGVNTMTIFYRCVG